MFGLVPNFQVLSFRLPGAAFAERKVDDGNLLGCIGCVGFDPVFERITCDMKKLSAVNKQIHEGPKANTVRIEEENTRMEMYSNLAIVNGTPGSVSEDDVRAMICAIETSGESLSGRYEALDVLHFYTINNVDYGGVSDVLEEVDAARRRTLYEDGGGV